MKVLFSLAINFLFALQQFLHVNAINASTTAKDAYVKTKYGQLRGFSIELDQSNGKQQVNVFLGIPFAKPPVDKLRFEKPVEPAPWPDQEIRDATKLPPPCFPHIRSRMIPSVKSSEDCLHLSIMTPGWRDGQNASFPVLVWIHGGSFEVGYSMLTPPEYFAKHYVARGMVVVCINYRLGLLGFASNGDNNGFAGNLGLWDQTAALKYINENIADFGGDPNRVTIWGGSAGSASVSALSYSTKSRDFFARAIQMSGSVYAGWAFNEGVVGTTQAMANELNCTSQDGAFARTEELKNCLRTKSVDQMFDAMEVLGPARRDIGAIKFQPRLDGDFFDEDPTSLVKSAPPKPTIAGVADWEYIAFTLFHKFTSTMDLDIKPAEQFKAFNKEKLATFIQQGVATKERFQSTQLASQIGADILKFYTKGSHDVKSDYKFYLAKYIELLGDLGMHLPLALEALDKLNANWPEVYLYKMDYYNKERFPENIPVKGAFHTLDICYMLGQCYLFDLSNNADDQALREVLLGAMERFVKTGNPSTDQFRWRPINKSSSLQYALLNPSPTMQSGLITGEKLKFWKEMRSNYSYDFVRLIPTTDPAPSNLANLNSTVTNFLVIFILIVYCMFI